MSSNFSRPTDDEMEYVINHYTDMLYRICLTMLQSASDAEDAVQEVMLKYMEKAPVFSEEEHRKAWLIRTAVNRCKNMLRFRAMHPMSDFGELLNKAAEWDNHDLLRILADLPMKYKSAMYLYYVEEYKVAEIALILNISGAAVKKRLQKGREMLRAAYFADELHSDEGERKDK